MELLFLRRQREKCWSVLVVELTRVWKLLGAVGLILNLHLLPASNVGFVDGNYIYNYIRITK